MAFKAQVVLLPIFLLSASRPKPWRTRSWCRLVTRAVVAISGRGARLQPHGLGMGATERAALIAGERAREIPITFDKGTEIVLEIP
jgi:hypothetical protein